MRAALMLFAAAALAACSGKSQPPVAAGASAADSADQVFIGMKTVMTTDGVQRATLIADTAFVLDDQTRFDLRRPHVTFTTETGAPQGTMEANKGMYNTRLQTLEGWGDVFIRMVDGRTLKSPHVIYNQMNHTVSSDTTYTITRGNDVQSGIGFTADQSFFPFTCLRACKGATSVKVPEK
jgi:LPS export ABC transporter protein LptC